MFHNDIQIQLSNNWKQNTNEDPIDLVPTGYFNTKSQMKNSQSKTRSKTYKSETKYIIQRQRVIRSFLNKQDESEVGTEPSIRKPVTLNTTPKALSITSISSPHLLFAELNEQSTNNNNRQQTIKKEVDHQSPVLIRRQRPTIENPCSLQPVSDITNMSGNQLSITIPPNFTFRNKSSRAFLSDRSSMKIDERISSPRIKSLNYSRTINETFPKQNIFNSKLIHQNPSLSTHTWTPRLPEQNSNPTRILTNTFRGKSHLSRYSINHHQYQLQSERNHINSKTNSIQDLYISSRTINNPHHEYEMNKKIVKPTFLIDDWDDPKSNHYWISDEDESDSADGNSSTITCNSQDSVQQYDHRSSLSNQYDLFSTRDIFINNSKSKPQRSTTKRSISRRHTYNIALPPVAEHLDDDEFN